MTDDNSVNQESWGKDETRQDFLFYATTAVAATGVQWRFGH